MASPDLRKLSTAAEYKLLQLASPASVAKLEGAKLRAAATKVKALAAKLTSQAKKAGKDKQAGAKAKAAAYEAAAKRLQARAAKPTAKSPSKKKAAKKTAKAPAKKTASKTTKAASAGKAKTAAKAVATGSKTTQSRPTPSPAATAKPARRASRTAVSPGPSMGADNVQRNPLTHRGTRPSRTQLLLEHQAAPIEPAASSASAHPASELSTSNLGELVRNTEARNTSLLAHSEQSVAERMDNMLSATANARIRGHAIGAGRRAQGRRDAAQRGEKRPEKGGSGE